MNADQVRIRDYTTKDAAAILEIQQATPQIAQWRAADYENLSRRPDGIVLIAPSVETGGVIVGFLAASAPGLEAEIQNLAVRVDCRRQGIAHALLAEVHRRLSARSVESVFLEVRPSNMAARSLYASFGYAECGLRKRYYVSDSEDALVLRLELFRRTGIGG